MNSGLREITVFSEKADGAIKHRFVLEGGCGDSGKEGKQLPII